MFEALEQNKAALKLLVAQLRQQYAYASVLAVMDDARTWQTSRSGVNIGTRRMSGGNGYVVRVFDEIGCVEYSFNEFDAGKIPAIVAAVAEKAAAAKAALPAGVAPLPTPIPADEPAALHKQAVYEIDPRQLGDEAILAKLNAIRAKGLETEGVLDVMCQATYRVFRKVFISEHRDLDQTVMWTNAVLVALAAKGQEVKQSYKGFSKLGGAELLDEVEAAVGQVTGEVVELLSSEPITPGEYDCVCDPATVGMIVHEAFGHGVEMDMFVKDRALAKSFIGKAVASGLVTMHDGAAVDEVATAAFDDEGTLTGDTIVIDKGILQTGMCDALSAARLGIAPTGNGRRESYERKAYTRMTNTYFEGGHDKPEDMIASIEYGFLLQSPSSGMEDPKNWGIQCMVSVAREIKNGKLTGKVFSPIVLTGYVPDLLKSITMAGPAVELGGSGFCGKGYKEWVKVSDGGPYMKARVRLG